MFPHPGIHHDGFLRRNLRVVFTVAMTSSCGQRRDQGWLSVGMIPAGITLGMIGPFLMQPAGGFWNFWHTYWVREKGMGMGKYFGRVTGLGYKPEDITRTGYIFDANNPKELAKFKQWLWINDIAPLCGIL
jgi:hypothetical protein